jgi:uncharacterized protein YbjT (DUF2867 family)
MVIAEPDRPSPDRRLILLTGATGYVGGALLSLLEARGLPVRCLVRHPGRIATSRPATTGLRVADLLDKASLPAVLEGVDTAYYLIHSMSEARDFVAADRLAAENFATAACAAGVRRIIYLGGLGGDDANSSRHLRSRREVGDILRRFGPPVIELQSSIILGSGSLSFEMIRALVERLPVMITPRWVRTSCQPIALEDVLQYLIGALGRPDTGPATYEIGGADVITYGDLMMEYARQRGLRRVMVPVPVLTPWLSGLWLWLVTPANHRIGRRLIGGLSTPTIAADGLARADFGVRPMGIGAAVARILDTEAVAPLRTDWPQALAHLPADGRVRELVVAGTEIAVCRREVPRTPEAAFTPVACLGGNRGWYCAPGLWRLRGLLDRLVGGPGLCSIGCGLEGPQVGAALDAWTVEAVEPHRRLLLRSTMLMPGRAWLDLAVSGESDRSVLQLTALFQPRGLAGLLYWQALRPIHRWLFSRQVRKLVAEARELDAVHHEHRSERTPSE